MSKIVVLCGLGDQEKLDRNQIFRSVPIGLHFISPGIYSEIPPAILPETTAEIFRIFLHKNPEGIPPEISLWRSLENRPVICLLTIPPAIYPGNYCDIEHPASPSEIQRKFFKNFSFLQHFFQGIPLFLIFSMDSSKKHF